MTPYGTTNTACERIALLVAAACAAASPAVCVAELSFGAGVDMEYTSNSTRVAENGPADTIRTVFAGAVYRHRTADSEIRLRAVGEFHDYRNDTFGDSFDGEGDAFGQWTLYPQRASWVVEDRYQQVVVDTLAADTPANRENANVFSTGPDFTFRISPIQSFRLGVRQGMVRISNVEVDNDRTAAAASWLYDVTPNTTLSANHEFVRVKYDDNVLNADYDRVNVFARAAIRPGRSTVTLDLGGTEIDHARLGELRGSMARLSWNRVISSNATFSLAAASGYSDAGAELGTGGQVADLVFTGGASIAAESDLFYSRRFDAQYIRTGAVGWSLSGRSREIDYETTVQDREERSAQIDVTIGAASRNSWTAYASWDETVFTGLDREDEQRNLGVRYARNLGRGYEAMLQGRRLQNISSNPTLDFVEYRYLLSFSYRTSSLFTR